jgi:hypothetical protein
MASRLPPAGAQINIGDDDDPAVEAGHKVQQHLQTATAMMNTVATARRQARRGGVRPEGDRPVAEAGVDRADLTRQEHGADPARGQKRPPSPTPEPGNDQAPALPNLRLEADPGQADADRDALADDILDQQGRRDPRDAKERAQELGLTVIAGGPGVDDAAAAGAQEAAESADQAMLQAQDDRDGATVSHIGGSNPGAGDGPLVRDGRGDASAAARDDAPEDREPLLRGSGDPLKTGSDDPLNRHGSPDAGPDLDGPTLSPGGPRR